MILSRRLALIATAAILGLSACGDPSTQSSAPQPKVISIGQASSGRQSTSADSAEAGRMMMPMQDIVYVVNGQLVPLPLSAQAWLLPAGAKPDMTRVQAIAAALGVTGAIRELPADQGGGWMIGAADYSSASLSVSADGMLSWWFNTGPTVGAGYVGCEVPQIEPAIDPPVDTVGPLVDIAPCADPVPPVGVPSSAEARTKAEAFFASLGYDLSKFELDVYADDWSANVTAYLMLDGMRSPMSLSVGYGAEGALTWASGYLAEPISQGQYPLISVQDGLVRLDDQNSWWGFGPMLRSLDDTTVGGATTNVVGAPEPAPATPVEVVPVDPAPADTTPGVPADTAPAVPVDTVVVDPILIDPVPVDTTPLEPMVVTINSVKADLTMVWADDGSIWLVPAYTYASTEFGNYTVIAIVDDLIDIPAMDPPVTIEPLPIDVPITIEPQPDPNTVDPSPGQTAPVDQPPVAIDEAATALVGLTEADAQLAAEAKGWTIRVSVRDGEVLPSTADYVFNRVNVEVIDGVVTAVGSIG